MSCCAKSDQSITTEACDKMSFKHLKPAEIRSVSDVINQTQQ